MSEQTTDQTTELTFSDLGKEELASMLQAKIAELNEANATINEKDKAIVSLKSKALVVHEENQLLQHSPQYAQQAAEMKYQLAMAEKFVASGAFPKSSPEQIYVKMKAGKEMGMTEMEAVNSLYFVNGKLEPYGKGMVALLTKKGFKVTYKETAERCDVTAIDSDGNEYTETASASDPLIKSSNAAKISLRNKLRFHAVRTLLNFQLPHLISSVADLFESIHENAKVDNNGNTLVMPGNEEVLQSINNCNSLEELEEVYNDNRLSITKDINLASALGQAKKRFENG